jgi:predicted DNA binding CopG/RHH family protein
MDEHQFAGGHAVESQQETSGRAVKINRRRTGKAVAEYRKTGASQVTVTIPRDVLDQFEQIASETGVNRQHLMREALTMYGAILASGGRFYQLPGVRRAG